jgi:hypothetical protein
MTVESQVKEAAKGLDSLIPPKELGKHDYHQVNITVPNPTIVLENKVIPITIMDVVAALGLTVGFIVLGFALMNFR